jgi:hypothetical protein
VIDRRSTAAWLAIAIAGGCAAPDAAGPGFPVPPPPPEDAENSSPMPLVFDASESELAPPPAPSPPVAPVGPEVWLKGSTHVHAKPSGDSSEPIGDVIGWYEKHGYDFIALTDHNRVSEIAAGDDTRGQVTVRSPASGLIVFAGIELTHNPVGCQPAGDRSRKCRIHVNVLGVTARPGGRLEWAERRSHARVDMYQAALVAAKALGGTIVQLNHPQWFWGMTQDVLVEIAHRGVQLVEIENVQFDKWNVGDKAHASVTTLWDAALGRGATLWGVASDDAHDYRPGHGRYPAGGGWIVVKARRDPQAILDALAAGRFYASTGVALDRAEVDGEDLVVEVAATETQNTTMTWIENGAVVETVVGKVARRTLPATGYVRAVVSRDDGKRAWVQPARR